MEKLDKNSQICNGSSSKTVAKWGIVNENLSLLKTFRLEKLNSLYDPHPKKSAIILESDQYFHLSLPCGSFLWVVCFWVLFGMLYVWDFLIVHKSTN